SPDTRLRSLTDLERAGPGAAGMGQARNSIARPMTNSQDPKAGARCDPGAEPPTGSAAGPMARSSSSGSCPVVRPAHAPSGVAVALPGITFHFVHVFPLDLLSRSRAMHTA